MKLGTSNATSRFGSSFARVVWGGVVEEIPPEPDIGYAYIWPTVTVESAPETTTGYRWKVRTPIGSGTYTVVKTVTPSVAIGTELDATTYHETYNTEFDAIVVSYNGGGESPSTYDPFQFWTSPSAVAPLLTANAVSSTQINLAWTFSPDPANGGFIVFRDGVEIARPAAADRTYEDADGEVETQYAYTVRPYNENPAILGVARADSLGVVSNVATETTNTELTTTAYIDAISALTLPPLAHLPLVTNADSSLNGEFFDGVATGVTFGQSSIIFEGGSSALFGPTSVIQMPNSFGFSVECAMVAWIEFQSTPTGLIRIGTQDSGWGIIVLDGKIYGNVDFVGTFGGDTFVVVPNTKYCVIALRNNAGGWQLYVNGVLGGYSINTSPPTPGDGYLGSATNDASTSFRMHHFSVHYNGTVSPDATFAAAIYAAGAP